jgi:hypothetical protein
LARDLLCLLTVSEPSAVWIGGEWREVMLTKHRFIPPEQPEWLRRIGQPEHCSRCECVLDLTEERLCSECDDHQWCLDRPHAGDWEPEA